MTITKITKFERGMFTEDYFDEFGENASIDYFYLYWSIDLMEDDFGLEIELSVQNIAFVGTHDDEHGNAYEVEFEGQFVPESVRITNVSESVDLSINLIEVDYKNKSIDIVI